MPDQFRKLNIVCPHCGHEFDKSDSLEMVNDASDMEKFEVRCDNERCDKVFTVEVEIYYSTKIELLPAMDDEEDSE